VRKTKSKRAKYFIIYLPLKTLNNGAKTLTLCKHQKKEKNNFAVDYKFYEKLDN